jgi:hypothetical protein
LIRSIREFSTPPNFGQLGDVLANKAKDNLKFCVSSCTFDKPIASLKPQLIPILAFALLGTLACISFTQLCQFLASGTFHTTLLLITFLLPKVSFVPIHFDAKCNFDAKCKAVAGQRSRC